MAREGKKAPVQKEEVALVARQAPVVQQARVQRVEAEKRRHQPAKGSEQELKTGKHSSSSNLLTVFPAVKLKSKRKR
jgi:hypothetical protein